ncbi:MAG: hypothetical protein ACOC04_01520 [Halothece sp.]
MSNEAKRTTLYFSQKDVEVIENWAKTRNLSFSKAAIDLIRKGSNKDNYEENKVNEHEQRLQDAEYWIQEYKTLIITLQKKMQRLTQLLAATRLGEISRDFVWDPDQPPRRQIPIYLWYEPSDPKKKNNHEKSGITKQYLLQKLFGLEGESLFNNWCKKLELSEEKQQINYLCQISGAKIKASNKEGANNRYVINHLFQTNHLFQPKEEQTPPNTQQN